MGEFIVEPMDMEQLVREMARLLEVSISKNCSLGFDFEPGLPAIEGDITQIRQVVLNLIVNAAEAIGEKEPGEILLKVSLQTEGSSTRKQVCLEVSDNGCGMDARTQEKIFEPFFTTKFTGRGLGLSAIQGIVQGHRACLEVKSTPDQGSVFKVLFPASDKSPTQAAANTDSGCDWQTQGTVLVVDDESDIRDVAREMFKMMGLEVITASDGDEGIAMFRDKHQDLSLVLLDMTMPRVNGAEAYRQFQQIDSSVPTVISSGFNQDSASSQFEGESFSGFIQKPYLYRDLVKVTRQAINPG